MKLTYKNLINGLILIILCQGFIYAQNSRLDAHVFDAGFAIPNSASTVVNSFIGQPITGNSQNGNIVVHSGFGAALLKSVVNGIDVETQTGELPRDYKLEQNYPNPFNPNTYIRFAIPKAGQVRLEIFNILGERVALLVDGVKPAGIHEVNFAAGNLASGLYIYRMNAGNFTAIRKMVLMK